MMRIVEDRFEENSMRTNKFQINLGNIYKARRKSDRTAGDSGFQKTLRRQRKREEGLATQKAVRGSDGGQIESEDTDAISGMPNLASLYQ
jgi:hypothetical protein